MVTDRHGTPQECSRIIRTLLLDCDKVLDLGCGSRTHTAGFRYPVWVDIDSKLHPDPRILNLDIRDTPQIFRRMRFDAALMTDVIQNIPKPDGIKLAQDLEKVCDRIVLFTPVGNVWVSQEESTDPHKHRSGWMPYELVAWGYETWTWPSFHNFDGTIFGAFFAWKWMDGQTTKADEIAKLSGVMP